MRVCASTFNIICTRDATQITLRTKPAECNYRRMMEVLFFFSVLLADAGWLAHANRRRPVRMLRCFWTHAFRKFGGDFLLDLFCSRGNYKPTHPPTTTRAHVPISSGRTENRIKTHVRTDTVCVASNFEKPTHGMDTNTRALGRTVSCGRRTRISF